MAEKEATVYIVDVGPSMSSKNNGRPETDFDFAMTYVWDKITSTASTFRLDLLGHSLTYPDTANELGGEESFENISVLQDISQILLKDLKQLRQRIQLSNTGNGDAISAIVIAIQMITKYCKKLKYKRKIVLVTDGRGSLDADESSISEITRKITQDGIELVIVGVDFDDLEYGFKEEAKDVQK
ncbi:MAG: hypothetical protein Q9214_003794, partial [Letrouitia sp. 1 TL-2023]